MTKIKNVVKVMNFHSLLNVDKSRREAEKYQNVGQQITDILEKIVYNKNIVLDKKVLLPDASKPCLNIYIANDYGFCGDFNSAVSRQIKKDKGVYKIIIGSKITFNDDSVVLKINKEDFESRVKEIETHISLAILNGDYSQINLYYNHYYSSTSFEFLKLNLFPVKHTGNYYDGDDFVTETDLQSLISSLITFYICYQIKMCESISFAAENVLRSQITSCALDKISERESQERNLLFKEKKEKAILKSVENFKKIAE